MRRNRPLGDECSRLGTGQDSGARVDQFCVACRRRRLARSARPIRSALRNQDRGELVDSQRGDLRWSLHYLCRGDRLAIEPIVDVGGLITDSNNLETMIDRHGDLAPHDPAVVTRLAELCWLIAEFWLASVEVSGETADVVQMERGIALMLQVLDPCIVNQLA